MEFIFKESININGIKGKHLSQGRINGLSDGLSKIDRVVEHIFNKRKKILFEAYNKGGSGTFWKPQKSRSSLDKL